MSDFLTELTPDQHVPQVTTAYIGAYVFEVTEVYCSVTRSYSSSSSSSNSSSSSSSGSSIVVVVVVVVVVVAVVVVVVV